MIKKDRVYEKTKKSKHMLIIIFTGLLGVLLSVRLFSLTVLQHEKWQSCADEASLRAVYETAPRGDILDRNGEIIASSRPVYSVNISRVDITREKALENTARVMDILTQRGENITTTQEEVREALSDRGYSSYMPITLAEDISEETADIILAESLPQVQVSVNYVRDYPEGAFASHVIGYMGRISEEEKEEYVEEGVYRADELIGKEGLEKAFESKLKGEDGVSRLQVDSSGNVKKLLEKSRGKKGEDIKTTIDSELQKVTEEALEQAVMEAAAGGTFKSRYGDCKMTYAENAAVGAAVAIEVSSGEVLAMASFPDFDPNDFAVSITEEKWEALQAENPEDPLSPAPLYNVASMTAVQPGSTFKPVTALAALSCGLDRSRYLYDGGAVSAGDRTFGCLLWNESREGHGYVDLKKAMAVSCNYYFYDIAAGRDFASGRSLGYERKMNVSRINEYARGLGLGEKTGIQIPESSGTLPTKELKINGIKSGLRNYLLAESETYFSRSILKRREELREEIEKIVNWTDKDLTLKEIIGKLKRKDFIKDDKIENLARVCKYDYFDQADWSLGDTFNVAIGQGDNAYTTLQMAGYMASLGSGGQRKEATLIIESEKEGSKEEEVKNSEEKSALSEKDIDYIIEAMTEVTEDESGSLYSMFSAFPYRVAAKTGTAQRAGKISTGDEKDYIRRHLHLIAPGVSFKDAEEEAQRLMREYPDLYEEEDAALRRAVINLSGREITSEDIDAYKESYDSFAWTVALAPAEEPEIAVAVMLVQGKTSSNAAPVAREIIGKYGENAEWEELF